jgi:hypothetical protein
MRNCWQQLLEHFHTLAPKLGPVQRDARDIATWMGQASDKADTHWIADRRHHDRYRRGRSLRGESSRRAHGDDHVGTELNEL